MASALWKSGTPGEWRRLRGAFSDILVRHGKPRLAELEAWLWDELPAAVLARGGHMTKEEMVRLVDWKVGLRGKMRPALKGYAAALQPAAVEAASRAAFALLSGKGGGGSGGATPDAAADAALDALSAPLKGVGPATASAALAALDRSLPFMSDEALAAALPGPAKYTKQEFGALRRALRAKADELTTAGGGGGGGGGGEEAWDAAWVERCLFAAALEAKGGGGGGGGGKDGGGKAVASGSGSKEPAKRQAGGGGGDGGGSAAKRRRGKA